MATRLAAAIKGYETIIAIGASFDARHYAYFHNTTTAGVFGAAAARAALLGLNEAQMIDALGLAGSISGGLWQMRHEQTLAKQWHLVHSVETGQRAGNYAAAGITGPLWILEGPQGLYAATCDNPKPLETGSGWRIDEVSFKPWGGLSPCPSDDRCCAGTEGERRIGGGYSR